MNRLRSPRRSARWAIIAGAATRTQAPAEINSPISAAVRPLSASQTGQNGSQTPTKPNAAA